MATREGGQIREEDDKRGKQQTQTASYYVSIDEICPFSHPHPAPRHHHSSNHCPPFTASRYIKQIQSNPPTRRPQQKYLTPLSNSSQKQPTLGNSGPVSLSVS
ncbi:hypothetical protein L2E82_19007 [Cichorium intybus]|uniref:Uncharacterized protein n=1 Tax=Cichorium intybus TaxID=13427 RepID=A0ACB9FBZ9_CICIN|nr:hypothetical protein L2E82_19007 [Cichorium intybus]